MKTKLRILTGALLVCACSLAVSAQNDPSPTPLGKEKSFDEFNKIQVLNFQDEPLGRLKDLGIDLVNGRIVEVLMVSDSSLDVAHKIVAVPPLAFYPDVLNGVYRLNVSTEEFKAAPAIDLAEWLDQGRSQRIAAAYARFGLEPYFLQEGVTATTKSGRPKVALGYVERSSKIVDLPVGNFQDQKFGKVWSLTLDIPKGRILNVIVLAPGNFKTKSVIPATALAFNAKRDGLLLDDTKLEFANEPRFVFTEAAFGQDAYSEQEAYTGPHTAVALEQGNSYRDIDRTVLINKSIRTAKLNSRNVQVGTLNGRVTLRGQVPTEDDKMKIGAIAITASSLELVDNQITVGKTAARN